jgi:hypothetical protein
MLRRLIYCDWTVFLLGSNVCIWKQARELVIMSEPKSTSPLILPANEVTKGDISFGFMQTSLHYRLSRMPQRRRSNWDGRQAIGARLMKGEPRALFVLMSS